LGLVTRWEPLISSPSSIAFFPSAFFAAFSYRFASSCHDLYSYNIFPIRVMILITASGTEIAIGAADVDLLESLHSTKRSKELPISTCLFLGISIAPDFSLLNHNKLLNYFYQ
jgi:hypothetical protein